MKHPAIIEATLKSEGLGTELNGYVNDPRDAGGETYIGISRLYNPEWEGWAIIDKAKAENKLVEIVFDLQLVELARQLYIRKYYTPLILNIIDDEDVAFTLYDSHVLMGYGLTVKWAQIATNILNDGGRLWPDIETDGVMGPITASVINTAAIFNKGQFLLYFNCQRGACHIERAIQNKGQERFMVGWANRIIANMKRTMT